MAEGDFWKCMVLIFIAKIIISIFGANIKIVYLNKHLQNQIINYFTTYLECV